MELEIYADVVCPWCYIGKIRMERAVSTFDGEVTIRMRPFQLDPRVDGEGLPLLDWLGRRYGGPDRARQAMAHVTSVAAAEGLQLNFDRAILADTFDSHRLLWFVDRPEAVVFGAGPDSQTELADLLFQAHFADGLHLGSIDVLIGLTEKLEIDGERVRRLLTSTEGVAEVRGQLAVASDLGITSVPTFVAAGRYAVSGAQETGTMTGFIEDVARREGLATTLPNLIPGQRSAGAYDGDSRVN